MPDTYYLNNDSKNWKIHLNNLIAPNNENLKIISKQQDLILQDNFKITNDIINLQKKVAIEGHLDTTNAHVNIPITYNNFSFCDPSNMQSVLTKSENQWIDLSGFGYKIEVTPQSERSSIYLRMKINFFSSHQAGQLISFALYRDISGGANSQELFADIDFGTDSASSNNSIYTAEFIDDPNTTNNVCYYLKYKLSNTIANSIDISSGVLGIDNSNINFLMTQELYKPVTDGCFNEIEPAADICLNIYDYIYNKEINANFRNITLTNNTIYGDISINGQADINNVLNINQALNAYGGVTMTAETPKISNIDFINMISNSNINCKELTVTDLSLNDSATINGIINANNGAHIINNVDVSGDISINGLATFKNGLTINSGILKANEGINMNNNNILNCDNAKIKKIDVSNITSLTGLLTANSDITITGLMNLLNSTSDISSTGNLDVNNSTNLNNGLNTNILNVTGTLDLCDNNIIDCSLLTAKKVEVKNDVLLSGLLTVNEEIIVNNNVTVSGDLVLTDSSNDISGIDLSGNKILKCSEIHGPSIITIDPSGIDDNTGKVVIRGGLVVEGLNTNIQSIDVDLSNNGITLDLSNNLEAGFIIKSGGSIDASFVYNTNENSWKTYNSDFSLDNIDVGGDIIGDISCNLTGSITGELVTTDTIFGNIINSKFKNKTITTNDISDNTITANEISNNAITINEITDNTITATQIKDNTILEANIQDDSITASVIAPNAITETEISNNSITADVIAPNAITETEILNTSILNENIDTISGEKIVGTISYELIADALSSQSVDVSVDINNTVDSSNSTYNDKLFNLTNGCLYFYSLQNSCWKKITISEIIVPPVLYSLTSGNYVTLNSGSNLEIFKGYIPSNWKDTIVMARYKIDTNASQIDDVHYVFGWLQNTGYTGWRTNMDWGTMIWRGNKQPILEFHSGWSYRPFAGDGGNKPYQLFGQDTTPEDDSEVFIAAKFYKEDNTGSLYVDSLGFYNADFYIKYKNVWYSLHNDTYYYKRFTIGTKRPHVGNHNNQNNLYLATQTSNSENALGFDFTFGGHNRDFNNVTFPGGHSNGYARQFILPKSPNQNFQHPTSTNHQFPYLENEYSEFKSFPGTISDTYVIETNHDVMDLQEIQNVEDGTVEASAYGTVLFSPQNSILKTDGQEILASSPF